jgi:hypothetical protein
MEGELENPSEIVCTPVGVQLMDIGKPAYTEYDFSPDALFDFLDNHPELDMSKVRMGHIHTHHDMSTYFSPTDQDELQINAPNHAYYLSLIVNFSSQFCAKIAFVGKEASSRKIKNRQGEWVTISGEQEKEVLYTIDLEIEMEMDEQLLDRFDKLEEENQAKEARRKELAKEASKMQHVNSFGMYTGGTGYQRRMQQEWNDAWLDDQPWDNEFASREAVSYHVINEPNVEEILVECIPTSDAEDSLSVALNSQWKDITSKNVTLDQAVESFSSMFSYYVYEEYWFGQMSEHQKTKLFDICYKLIKDCKKGGKFRQTLMEVFKNQD